MRLTFPYTSLVIALLLSIFSIKAVSQIKGLIPSQYYPAKEYKAGTQNWAIAEDARGVLYFGNAHGVLQYNGHDWQLIKLSNGSAARSLAIDDRGLIYVGGFNEIGLLLPDDKGQLGYRSLNSFVDVDAKDFGEVWKITTLNDSVFFTTQQFLFCWANNELTYWQNERGRFYLSHIMDNRLVVQSIGEGLLELVHGKLIPVKGGEHFVNHRIHTILPADNGYLACTRTNGFYLIQNDGERIRVSSLASLGSKAKALNRYFTKNTYYQGTTLLGGLFGFSSLEGDVLIVDGEWNTVDIINAETIGKASKAYYLHQSANGVLWLALDNGIAMSEVQLPFRIWDEGRGISGVITDVAQLRDTLYISTGSAVFCTSAKSQKPFELTQFTPIEASVEQAWEFLYFIPPCPQWQSPYSINSPPNFSEQDAILLVATSKGLFQLNGTKAQRVARYDVILKLHQYRKDPSKLYFGTPSGLAALQYHEGKWIDLGYQFDVHNGVNEIGEDADGGLWFSSNYFGLFNAPFPIGIKSDSSAVRFYGEGQGISSTRSIGIYDDYNPVLFEIDGRTYSYNSIADEFEAYVFEPIAESEIDENESDADSLFWRAINPDILTFLYVAHLTDTVLWFSTDLGINRYQHNGYRNFSQIPSPIITSVNVSDSVIYGGTNFFQHQPFNENFKGNLVDPSPIINHSHRIRFADNTLTFNYVLPFTEGVKPNTYSYFLDGYDKEWSAWKAENKKEYTNLQPRDYIFKVKSKNVYGIVSDAAEFHFTILRPWYRSYLAYVFYLILIIGLVTLIVMFYTYRLVQEKNKLEDVVRERTQEILVQKEEILVQSEHLKDANDWILAKNTELEEQKLELEAKKNQLEISDATKNKFFRIIAHDLRNPISTAVSTTEYILSNFDSAENDSIKAFLEKLHRLSLTTYSLLENLLDWSSSQMGEIRYNPIRVELSFMVTDSIDLVKSMIDAKGIQVNLDLPETLEVFADENMLRTVIRNLISNAVKFTPDNGSIKISATEKGEYCELSVEDNGVGITEENLTNLFKIDRDYKTLGTHNERGAGLGLIICQEFVEQNGGKILVESKLGKGSKFTITVKLAEMIG